MDAKKFYNCIAEGYDSTFRETKYKIQDEFLRDKLIRKGFDLGNVLDIGCGTGLLLEIMDIPHDNYLGVDISSNMCLQAQKKFPKHKFVAEDFLKLNAQDSSFDSIISLYGSFTYILQPELAIKKIENLLSPNGMFFLVVYADKDSSPGFNSGIPIYRWKKSNINKLFDKKIFKTKVKGFDFFGESIPDIFAEYYYMFEENTIANLIPDRCRYLMIEGSLRHGEALFE